MAEILVVEDESIIAKDLQRSLQRLGHKVGQPVATGAEALGRAQAQRPDLVLMDIHLRGDMDGVEAARQLRALHPVPVVFLTSYADDATLERAIAASPFGYLVKPFDEQELKTTVEVVLRKHQQEQQLAERSAWLAATLSSLGDAVLATDAAGRVTFLNPAAEALTGWAQAEAHGRPAGEVLALREASDQQALDPVAQALASGAAPAAGPALLRRRDGRSLLVEQSTGRVEDAAGRPSGAVVSLRDLSGRSEVEARMRHAERLASLGTLAAGAAHEINNPLACVLGNLEYVLTTLPESGPVSEADLAEVRLALAEAVDGGKRVRNIVGGLKDFARTDAGSAQRCEVRPALERALVLAGPTLRGHASVELRCAELPEVALDAGQLVQVVLNLLLNAAQAIPQGRQGRVTVEARQEQGQLAIQVTDDGVGMTPEVQARIFDPFFTTKPIGQGTGLGLAVCHGIVSTARGSIAVRSTPGQGSEFRLLLPVA